MEQEKKVAEIEQAVELLRNTAGTHETVIRQIGKDLSDVSGIVKSLKEIHDIKASDRVKSEEVLVELKKTYEDMNQKKIQLLANNQREIYASQKINALTIMTRKDVLSAVDPETNKSLYTNDKARETAVFEKLNDSKEYLQASEELEKIQYKNKELQNDLDHLKNMSRLQHRQLDVGIVWRDE